ncbi:MAG: hypothetical protein M0Z38_02660 [Deltaproteobacteria bacterium]|nr:hypothetical protein [Deltaproteobacteria bacterium]
MKYFLAIGLASIIGASALILLHPYRAVTGLSLSEVRNSSSQIFIHGTPVCVFKLDDGILARVGRCADTAEAESGTLEGNSPYSGDQEIELPPGHPPVNRDVLPDGQRRVLI